MIPCPGWLSEVDGPPMGLSQWCGTAATPNARPPPSPGSGGPSGGMGIVPLPAQRRPAAAKAYDHYILVLSILLCRKGRR